MRFQICVRENPTRLTAIVATALVLLEITGALANEQGKGPLKVPADYSEFESDMSGSYFITKPLKQKYGNLLKRVGELRAEIDGARIDESQAQREITRLQSEIDETLREIEKTKLYIPGAQVENRAAAKNIPLGAQNLLLIDAENVEIQGGDGPEVKFVVKKTVLGELEKNQDLTADFDGIELVVRKSSGKEMFGFYKEAANRPDLKHQHEQFPFKPFLDHDFLFVTIKGLSYDEGNRPIKLELRNESGLVSVRSDWRRHAKLIVTIPRCRGVAVRGGLGGFRVRSLNSPLMVQGTGNRDYQARYQVTDLGGPLTASGIPIHDIDGVKGDVAILATEYIEDVATSHSADGVTMRPAPPHPSHYKGIEGNLRVNCCRADLTLVDIAGRVDVENEFGKTVWRSTRPIAAMDHRIVSQSGAIDVGFSPSALGKLRVALFTACGAVHLPAGDQGFESKMYHGNIGDTTARSWNGFVSGDGDVQQLESSRYLFQRMPAALRGDHRSQGVDIISRAGTITYEPTADGETDRK
jgi:hypothetical protein